MVSLKVSSGFYNIEQIRLEGYRCVNRACPFILIGGHFKFQGQSILEMILETILETIVLKKNNFFDCKIENFALQSRKIFRTQFKICWENGEKQIQHFLLWFFLNVAILKYNAVCLLKLNIFVGPTFFVLKTKYSDECMLH